MSYFDAQFVDGLSDNNFAERAALDRCLRDTEKPDAEQVKPYIKELLEDYTARFKGIPLGEYGWELHNVRDDLAKFIPDEELSKYAQELAYEEKLHEGIPTPFWPMSATAASMETNISEVLWAARRMVPRSRTVTSTLLRPFSTLKTTEASASV